MSYLMMEIVLYLLAAALIGAFIGWTVKKITSDRNLAAVENNQVIALGHLQADRDNYRAKCEELNASLEKLKKLASRAASNHEVSTVSPTVAQMGSGGVRSLWPYAVEEIEGVGTTYGNRLRAVRIENTEQLLNYCSESAKQTEVAQQVKVEPHVVSSWISMADMMRISGIRGQIAALLEASGIASVSELARQEGAALAAKMARVNAESHTLESVPAADIVLLWIEDAKALPAKIVSLVPK